MTSSRRPAPIDDGIRYTRTTAGARRTAALVKQLRIERERFPLA